MASALALPFGVAVELPLDLGWWPEADVLPLGVADGAGLSPPPLQADSAAASAAANAIVGTEIALRERNTRTDT